MTRINQPEFVLFPIANARTGYQPVALPVVLVVPWRRTKTGITVDASDVFNVSFKIEGAPGKVPVSGFENKGIFVPDTERFSLELDSSELLRYVMRFDNATVVDQDTGETKDYSEIESGDTVQVTLASDIKGEFVWYSDADYYDLSLVSIRTYDLLPLGDYTFAWHASYYRRVMSPNNEFNCIDTNFTGLARTGIQHQHPGDVHQEMINLTPAIYMDGVRPDQDSTIKFYRPLADAMQDIFDETELIRKLNSIADIPASYIPYLSFLLGWDLPYFPGSTDEMRRRILLNARYLQELKGSKRAIIDLFESFGFIINLINLWSTTDGKRLLAPNEPLPDQYDSQQIVQTTICRADPLISDWTNASLSDEEKQGFGDFTVPLLNRPIQNIITVEAWVVNTSSPVYDSLITAVNEYASLESDLASTDADGFITCPAFHEILEAGQVIGYSQVLLGARDETADKSLGQGPISKYTITYDPYFNAVNIKFGRNLDLAENERLFVFATYNTTKTTIPATNANLRTNRFDLIILERPDGTEVDANVLNFLVDFVFRLKAFHSLLRKIIYTTDHNSVYNVSDLCVGGDTTQRAGTSIGEFQVPPPVDPGEVEEINCAERDATSRFKKVDINTRNIILDGVESEFQSWKDLDNTHVIPTGFINTHNSISVLPINIPTRDECQFTDRGQDKKYADDIDLDHETDTRSTACNTSRTTEDFCYKGRVGQDVSLTRELIANETFRLKPCELSLGNGFYYLNDNKLQYTNRDTLESTINNVNESLFRPGLEIQKDNLHIPGHRFPTLGNLTSDFTHPDWTARPWDDQFNPLCSNGTESLQVSIGLDTNGDEILVFDNTPLVYYGNGIAPDIDGLDTQTNSNNYFITHAVYMYTAPNHPAITLDQVVILDSDSTDPDTICVPEELADVFDSASG